MKIPATKTLLVLLLLASIIEVYAQKRHDAFNEEQGKVYQFLEKNIPFETTKDSNMVYAFAFKVLVKKMGKKHQKVMSITATDTIAYSVYPGYKFLETINYCLFMNRHKEATFIIPIVLEIFNTKLLNFPAKVDVLDVVQSAFSYSPGNYFEDIGSRIYFRPYLLRMGKTVVE